MPVYVYKCEKCKKTIEVQQKITDKPYISHNQIDFTCPGNISRQICSPGFVFKGTGFYSTDYKKKEKETEKV